MVCDIKTFANRQGSFLIPVLLIISLFNGINSQTSPGNPTIVGDFEKNEGETATLSCTAVGGNPLPLVEWYKNNQLVDPGSSSTGNGDGVYTIGSTSVTYNNYTFVVSRSDNLVSYICRVKNSVIANNLTRSWTISVYVQTQQPIITGPEPAITNALDAGSTYKYVCTASNGRPAPQIIWKLGTSLSTAVEFHQGISESTSTNADSTLSKTSNLSWVPITDDNGKNLYCETVQTIAGGSSTRKSSFVPINVQQTPLLQVGSASYTTQVGGSVTLACTVLTATPAITEVYWSRLINGAYNRISIDNVRFFGSTTSNANLTITSVALSDATSYRCSATNAAGTGTSSATTLSVTGSVSVRIERQASSSINIILDSRSYAVPVGQSVTLQCTVIAIPFQTSVYWQFIKNGQVETIDVVGNPQKYGGSNVTFPSLIIKTAEISDSGSYTCSAVNSGSNKTSEPISLDITGSAPLVQIDQDKYPSTSGNTVTLVCDVYSSLTVSRVYWEREVGGQFTTIDVTGNPSKYGGVTISSPSLVVKSVTTSDAGKYRCVAVNIAGTGQDTSVLEIQGNLPRVTIEKDSYSVNEGNAVTLACTVLSSTSTNIIDVSWQTIENGVSSTLNVNDPSKYSGASISNPSLTIFNAELTDNGQYRCTATNTVGTGESAITTLKVIAKPSFRISQSSYSVNYGSNVTLQVTISSPDAQILAINWQHTTKAGITNYILTGSGRYSGAIIGSPSLRISTVTFSDEGTYRCLVTSSAGSTTSGPISLTVIGTVPSVVIGSGSAVVFGGNVSISCSVSSNPIEQSVSWQKTVNGATTTLNINGNPRYEGGTLSNPSLSIYNVNLGDSGEYRCLATNIVGTGQSGPAMVDVTGGVPAVTIGSGSTVYVGDDVTISCFVSGTPAVTSVSWEQTINSTTTAVNINDLTKYSGGTLGTPSLTIKNVSKANEGSYRCRATNLIGTGQSVTSAFLSVIGGVPVTLIGPDVSVTIGNQATITCSVSGYPLSTSISWHKIANGVRTEIDTSQTRFSGGSISTPSLTINPVESSDEGDYQCTATNILGTSQSGTAYLDVLGSIPSVEIPSFSYTVAFGSQIRLQCVVNSIPPATSIRWLKTYQGVTSAIILSPSKYSGGTISDPSLRIFNAELSDEATYVCSATNIVGTGKSREMTLSVVVSLPTVQVGSSAYTGIGGGSVTLVCSIISSNPTATAVIWEKDINGNPTNVQNFMGGRISGGTVSQPSLTISSLTGSDTGTYYCSARNSVGTGSRSATSLTVQTTPEITVGQTSYEVVVGSSVTLTCTISSSPQATSVIWKRSVGGATLIIDAGSSRYSGGTVSSPSLVIKNATLSDTGQYVISVTNDAGVQSGPTIDLTVRGNRPNITLPQSTYNINYGQDVTLVCNVISDTTLTSVVWRKYNNSVPVNMVVTGLSRYSGGTTQTPSLTIRTLVFSDSGNYDCSATNSAGTSVSGQITLNVRGTVPSVNIPQPSYSVTYGGSVTLQCNVSSNPFQREVEWQRISNGVSTTINVASEPRYSGSSPNTPSLTITGAISGDAGVYVCSATNDAGKGVSGQTVLNVIGNLAQVRIAESRYSVLYGGSVYMECSVENALPPVTTVRWYRGTSINNINTSIDVTASKFSGGVLNNPSLNITNVIPSDEGYYSCNATNLVGTASAATFLDVFGDLPSVTLSNTSYTVMVGDPVTLACDYNSSPSPSTITWQRILNAQSSNINVLDSRYGGGTIVAPYLTIHSTLLSDAGVYTCSVTNQVGTSTSQPIFLFVNGSVPSVSIPQSTYSVNFGNPITIPCNVTAIPMATNVSWVKTSNGVSVTLDPAAQPSKYSGATLSNPNLTISSTDLTDEGNYVCAASNIVGTGSSNTALLDVIGDVPSITVTQTSYNVFVGSNVTLACSVSGNPPVTNVFWTVTRNGITQNVLTSGGSRFSNGNINIPSLTLTNAQQGDSGVFICKAQNSAGTSDGSGITLTVSGSLPSVRIPLSSYSVNFGDSVTIPCTITANPSVTSVFWELVSQTGIPTSISLVAPKYSGGTVSTPGLTIANTETTDQGFYRCLATNSIGTSTSDSTFLTVVGSVPSVSVAQSIYSVITNGDVTMTCSVSANPAATITWIFTANSGGTTTISSSSSKYTYSSSTTSSSLTVRTANSNDQGSYVCSASNAVGTRQATATLTVTGSYPSVNMQSTYSVITGSSINMICSVSANPAVTSITWQFQSASSNSFVSISSSSKYGISGTSGTSSTLTVRNSASSDQGVYRCQATNQVGTRSANTTLTVSGSLPLVNIPQNSYSVVTGQDAAIPCSVSASPTASISWIFISTSQSQTQISVSTTKYTFNPSSTDGTLIVRSTTSSDSGTYRCQATNSVGTSSDVATLSVTGSAPSVSFGSQSYTVITGNNVQLSCFVSATPAASGISWTFQSASGGGSLTITPSTSGYSIVTSSSLTQSTLTVLSAQSNDGGTYTCTATNSVGTRSASVSLSVSGSLPSVNIPQNSYSAVTGQDVTIPCSVSANPTASITWTFISTSQSQTQISTSTSKYTFNPSSTNGNLIVRSTTSTDSGTYRCQATNAVGTSSDVATLSVTGSLPSVNIPQNSYSAVTGQDVTIPCSVSASPTATIFWTFISTSQSQTQISTSTSKYTFNPSSTNGNLIVRSTTSSDSGRYRCGATNAVGTTSDSATLSVSGSVPSVSFGSQSYTVITGNNVQLLCFVSATPAASGITWTFQSASGGGSLTITPSTSGYSIVTSSSLTQSTLTVLSAQSNDGGTYTCTATNSVGTRSASVSLSVSGSLPSVNIPQNSYSAVTGQDVTIPCSVSASPTATIFWTFISTSQSQTQISTSTSKYTFNPSSTNGNLIVRSTTSSDSGTYRCGATNAVGTTSDSATLSVSGSLPTVTIPQTTYSAVIGSNQQIVCFVNANPTASSIEWTFRSSTSGSTITITSSTPGYSIVTPSTSQSTLTVQAVDNGDEGTYSCRATNQVGLGSDSAFLDVTGNLPTVNIQQNTYTSISGQDVSISCVVSANPSATISWIFIATNNAQTQITTSTADYSVTTSSTGSSLVVRATNSGDSGTYRCTATNSIGTASDSATLTVSGSLPTVNIPNNLYTAVQGQDATIPCSVSANPAATSFSWTFISSTSSQTQITQSTSKYTVSSSSTDRTLIVRGTTSADSGTYRCSATNAEGTASDQAALSVTGSRPVVDITQTSYTAITGSNVVIPCTVSASPAATSVQWKFTSGSGSEVTISASSSKYTLSNSLNFPQLTILSVSSTDSGTYQCSATNIVGTASDTASLSVTGSRPVVSISSSNYNVVIGNSVTIPCTITASPSATSISWFFTSNSNNRIQITTSSVKYTVSTGGSYYNLTVNSAASSDAGVYECRATNVIDTSTDSARLTVSGSIPVVSLPTTNYQITYGQNVTLRCSISATPNISSVQWERLVNGVYQSIPTPSSKYYGSSITDYDLTIVNLVFNDTGVYRCTATNQVGRGVSPNTASLQVLGDKPSVFVQQSSYSAVIGTNVSLACIVSVTTNDPPVLNVYWKKTTPSGSGTIDVSGSSKYSGSTIESPNLIITNLDVHDNGNYSCLATNAAGTSESGVTILTITGKVPFISIESTRYMVSLGHNVTLTCSVIADPPSTIVYWQRRNQLGSQNIFSNTNINRYGGVTLSDPSLIIYRVDYVDEGAYNCYARNAVGLSNSPTVNLYVLGSQPAPNIPLGSYSVLIGDDIQIPCSVTANPPVTSVEWTFRSSSGSTITISQSSTKYTLASGTSNPNLTVNSAALTDAGTYTCRATNIVGPGEDSATLTITGIIPNVTIPDTSLSIQKRQNITITCVVTEALPKETSVLWEFRANQGDSGTIISTASNPTKYQGGTVVVPSLTILSVAASDQGYYTCIASNIFGEGRSEQAFLEATGNAATVTVNPPSQSVLQKSTAFITCTITNANPAVTEVTWEKVSSGVTTSITVTGRFNGSTPSVPDLTISDLQPGDAGTYYCSARNAIGTTRSNTGSVLIVTGAVPSNIQIAGSSSRNVNLGGALTLQCSGQGQPSPTFTWIFSSSSSGSTVVGTGTTYTITNALRTNGGTYVCRATNSLGTLDSPGVNVNVQYAPVDVRGEAEKTVTATVNSQVTLTCSVDANPTATYQWYRNSQLVGSQQQYTFSYGGTNSQGDYTCRATNSIGSRDLLFTVSQAVGNTGASTVSSGLSTGEIAAIILALLLLLLLIIIIIICCLTHGVCGAICGKKQEVKGRVEPVVEKEVYKETQKEVIIPRFHEESIKGKSYREPARAGSYRSYPARASKYRQPSAVSRKDVDVRVQNGGFRKENDYEIVRYETVPPVTTQLVTESPRPHRLPALSYTYEDVEKKRKRRKKKKHHRRRHRDEGEEVVVETMRSASPVRYIEEPVEEVEVVRSASPTHYITEPSSEMVVERVIRSRSASPTRIIRTEAEEPTVVERVIRSSSPSRHVYRQEVEEPVEYSPSPGRRSHGYYDDERIIETTRSSRSPRRHRHQEDEEVIIQQRSPSTKRRYEENYITDDRDIIQEDGDLRAYNGVVYHEAPSRHGSGRYAVQSSERRSRSSRRHGSDDDVEVVYGKEYVVER